MTATPDNTPTDWRDIADQLTPDQVAALEYRDRNPVRPSSPDHSQGQLKVARSFARSNIVQAWLCDIPVPADAVDDVEQWQRWRGEYSRLYTVWSHREQTWAVQVYGTQYTDGRVERHVVTESPDAGMSAGDARRYAAALLDAADVLDGVNRET
jgi:hypothetical protein